VRKNVTPESWTAWVSRSTAAASGPAVILARPLTSSGTLTRDEQTFYAANRAHGIIS